MGINKINSESNWGEAAANLNNNFDTLNADILKIKDATTRNKGYFATSENLFSALPSAKVGDVAFVGAEYPYAVYRWDGIGWANNGEVGGESVDLHEYPTKDELSAEISGLVVQETGDGEGVVMSQKAVSAKLSELESKISRFPIDLVGSVRKTNGTFSDDNGYRHSDFVSVKNIKSINVKGYSGTYVTMLAYYNANKSFIGFYDIANGRHDINVLVESLPQNTEYIVASGITGEENLLSLELEKSIISNINDLNSHIRELNKQKIYHTNADNILSAASSIPAEVRHSGLIVSIIENGKSIMYRFLGTDDLANSGWWYSHERFWRKIANVGDKKADETLFIKKGKRVTTYGTFVDSANFNCTDFLPIPQTKVLKGYFDFNQYCSPIAFFDREKKYISSYTPQYYYFQYFEISEIPENAAFVVFTQFVGNGDEVAGLYDMDMGVDIFQLNSHKETLLTNIGFFPKNPNLPQAYKPLAFLHASDVHGVSERYTNIGKVLEHYPNLKFAMITGDLISGNFAESFDAYNSAISETSKPIMFVLGNHDVGDVADLSLELNGTNEQCYNKFYAPYIDTWGVSYSPNKNYYYYDDAESKIRMICLFEYDNLFELNAEGTALKEVRIKRSYSQEQINWFINALTSLPADYGVIIAQHQAEDVRQEGTNDFCSPVIPINWGFDAFFEYKNYRWILPINRIVDAFINKKSINETINQLGGNVPTLSLVADFTSRDDNQEFICYIGGHQHNDYIGFLAHYPQQMQIQIGCSKYDTSAQDCKREEGTISQDYINLMSIDRNKKTIQIARFGCDTSYLLQDRKSISISYRNFLLSR